MVTSTFDVDTRYVFTGQFLKSSALFVRRARMIEEAAHSATDEVAICEHRGLVCAAIMQCAAALETETHEVCAHGPGSYLGAEGTDALARDFLRPIADVIDDQRTLARFDLILHLLKRPPLSKGTNPYQATELVVRLRNELIHYKSHWGADMDKKKLQASLQTLGHKPAPFTHPSMNFFPHRCLSADCAAWALSSVVAFLEAFYVALGIPSRFEQYRCQLIP